MLSAARSMDDIIDMLVDAGFTPYSIVMPLESGLVNPIHVGLFVAGEQGRLTDLFLYLLCYIFLTGNLKGSILQNVTTQFPFRALSSLAIVKEIPPLWLELGRVDVWMAACLVC